MVLHILLLRCYRMSIGLSSIRIVVVNRDILNTYVDVCDRLKCLDWAIYGNSIVYDSSCSRSLPT